MIMMIIVFVKRKIEKKKEINFITTIFYSLAIK